MRFVAVKELIYFTVQILALVFLPASRLRCLYRRTAFVVLCLSQVLRGIASIYSPSFCTTSCPDKYRLRATTWDTAVLVVWTGRARDVEQKGNVMAHGNARMEKWRGKRRMAGVASSRALYRTRSIQHYYRWCAHLGCQQPTELTPPPI